jgi:hypothetical protein
LTESACRIVKALLISSDNEVVVENLKLMALMSEIPSIRTKLINIEVLTTLVVLLQTNSKNETVASPALMTVANLCHAPEHLCTSLQHRNAEEGVYQDFWKVEVIEQIVVEGEVEQGEEGKAKALKEAGGSGSDEEEEEEEDDDEEEEEEVKTKGKKIVKKYKTSFNTLLVCATCAHSCWKYNNPRFVLVFLLPIQNLKTHAPNHCGRRRLINMTITIHTNCFFSDVPYFLNFQVPRAHERDLPMHWFQRVGFLQS